MFKTESQATDDASFRKVRRPNTLRLNCKLEISPSTGTEDNVAFATPAILLDSHVINSPGFGWRHLQVLLMFFFIVGSFLHRTCVSVALVAMTTQGGHDQEVYNWTQEQQGNILGSFLWGYAVTQVPAGYLTTRFGAKRLLGLSIVLSSIISLCIPIVCRQWDWVGLTALRVCTGLVQGITFPGNFTLLGKWAVPQERSAASAFTIAAQPGGIFLAMSLSGVIAVNIGWQSIFYIFGSVTLVFAAVWFAFAADSPEEHRYISENERNYIRQSFGKASSSPRGPTPWRSILTSMPVISIIVANVGSAWSLWFLLVALPRYMNDIFALPISLNGVASGVPFLLTALIGPFLGFISDIIIRNRLVATSFARKLMNTIGCWGTALLFLCVNLTPKDYKIVQIIELTLAVGLSGGVYSGFLVNVVDLSPRYSGLTFAISNFVASVISALAPPTAGALVDSLGDDDGWSAAFYLAAGITSTAHLFYLIFASVELQPWNDDEETLDNNSDNVHKSTHIDTNDSTTNAEMSNLNKQSMVSIHDNYRHQSG